MLFVCLCCNVHFKGCVIYIVSTHTCVWAQGNVGVCNVCVHACMHVYVCVCVCVCISLRISEAHWTLWHTHTHTMASSGISMPMHGMFKKKFVYLIKQV